MDVLCDKAVNPTVSQFSLRALSQSGGLLLIPQIALHLPLHPLTQVVSATWTPGDGLFPGASGKQALAARWGEPTALGACAWVRAALLPLSHPSPAPWEDCRMKLAHGPLQR